MSKVPTEYVSGIAGSGKTFEVARRVREDSSYGVLCASTGIAAMNMGGAITLNSLLRYFDTDSLAEAYEMGRLTETLRKLATGLSDKEIFGEVDDVPPADGVRNLIVDEVSMVVARQLDIIYDACAEVNETLENHGYEPLGLIATGDFCQLPPIGVEKDPSMWPFRAKCWPEFAANTTKLTTNHRHGDPRFIDALNLIRAGKGMSGAKLLKECGVTFEKFRDNEWEGTTILGLNRDVDAHNAKRLKRLEGELESVPSYRVGKSGGDWKNIPFKFEYKVGALVMILANSGVCGTIITYVCKGCQRERTKDAYLRMVSENLRGSTPDRILTVEERAQGTSGQKVKPSKVLQSELHIEVDKEDQQKVAGGDALSSQGELCSLERREAPTKVREEPSRVHSSTAPGASELGQTRVHSRTQVSNGEEVGASSPSQGTGSSPKRSEERQQAREPGVNKSKTTTLGPDNVPILHAGILDSIGCPSCGCTDIEEISQTSFSYVNGDTGHIIGFTEDGFDVELIRTGETVHIDAIVRFNESVRLPKEFDEAETKENDPTTYPHWNEKKRRWVFGMIRYYPIRLAYATTIHKSQGLTLDNIQVDCRNAFLARPAMMYVALSRARTAEGIRIVGDLSLLAKRVRVAEEVKEWL